jgi:hypothetical protein
VPPPFFVGVKLVEEEEREGDVDKGDEEEEEEGWRWDGMDGGVNVDWNG